MLRGLIISLEGLRRDTRGNVAMIVGLAAVPLMGSVGVAIDLWRAQEAKSEFQSLSDAAALHAAVRGAASTGAREVAYAQSEARARTDAKDALFEGRWINDVDYEVRARGVVPTLLAHVLPGASNRVQISVVSIARLAEPRMVYEAPKFAMLDYEAGDYNRIGVYCYTPPDANSRSKAGSKSADTVGSRTSEVLIADNGGSTYKVTSKDMPRCDEGSYLSYHLHNSRNARTQTARWSDNSGYIYDYHTDTTMDGAGKETYGGLDPNQPILETVLCKTEAECQPVSKGGIIPEGKGRVPQQATEGCRPGWFMFYGWEDRPPPKMAPGETPPIAAPGCAWGARNSTCTDSDYDDIRIVMQCPRLEQVSERNIRLVK